MVVNLFVSLSILLSMAFGISPLISEDTVECKDFLLSTPPDLVVTDLIAAQHYDLGQVAVWSDADYLYVKYVTKPLGKFADVYLEETHLHVDIDPSLIPQKNGNPSPGQFDHQNTYGPDVVADTYTIPLDAGWTSGTDLYIAAHAAVKGVKRCVVHETAWGEGDDFPGNNWAMYFKYTMP